MTKLAVAIAFLALNFYTYHYLATEAVIPQRRHFAAFPLEVGGWTCPAARLMDKATISNLGVTDYLLCDFVRQDREAIDERGSVPRQVRGMHRRLTILLEAYLPGTTQARCR